MTSLDYSITLRIRHPHIDPQEISRQLGLEPQHAWRAGEPRRLDTGEITAGAYRETVWLGLLPQLARDNLSERRDPLGVVPEAVGESLPLATLYVAAMKMRRALPFWQTLAEQGGTVECLLQLQYDQRCQLDLSPSLLTTLAELRIALSLEVELSGSRAAAA